MTFEPMRSRMRSVASVVVVIAGAFINLATTVSYCPYMAHLSRTDAFQPGQTTLRYQVLAPRADYMDIRVMSGCSIVWVNRPSDFSPDAGQSSETANQLRLDCEQNLCDSVSCRDACRSLIVDVSRDADAVTETCTLDVTAGEHTTCNDDVVVELEVEVI